MRILVTLLVVLALGACATAQVAPQTVSKAVREAPCDASRMPAKPVFPMESLGEEDKKSVWTIGTTLWADYKARKAYELQLRTFAEGCAK